MSNQSKESTEVSSSPPQLRREVGFWGAILLGLGSMVGTGVFVSIGLGASVTGASVLVAVMVGAGVAICNGLSSAQLAANHPVSGGTYEYGYRYLKPWLGFSAGWMFLLAKSASAATAALGFAGYLLAVFGLETRWLQILLALIAVAGLTWIVLRGIRRSNLANTFIVGITLIILFLFIVIGAGSDSAKATAAFTPFWSSPDLTTGGFAGFIHGVRQFFYASALMFVAYTGYGRIATLGEEVKDPARTIPRAIITTMIITMVLYMGVAFVAIRTLGADGLAQTTLQTAAPLQAAAEMFGLPWAPSLIVLGAITAMLGVLLNLILGLSRVLFAMGRRGDMPSAVGRLDPRDDSPTVAIIVMGIVIGLLVLIGNVQTTWSFSAFTVLIYYALTNLSALQLADAERLYPRWISWTGLGACAALAFLVEPQIWLLGIGLLVVGLAWHFGMKWRN